MIKGVSAILLWFKLLSINKIENSLCITNVKNCYLEDEAGSSPGEYDEPLWTAGKQLRALLSIMQIGTASLSEERYSDYVSINNEMETIYSTTKVNDFDDENVKRPLEPDLTEIMFLQSGRADNEEEAEDEA